MPDPELKDDLPLSSWQKLLRQRVIQTLALYIPIGWVLNEIIAAASQNFALPGWVTSSAMILFIAGYPLWLFFHGYFNGQKPALLRMSKVGKKALF